MIEQTTTLVLPSQTDKEYRVQLCQKDGLWDVTVYTGLRDNSHTAHPQTPKSLVYEHALKIFTATVEQKIKEGYIAIQTQEQAHSQALLHGYLMSANLEGIKQLLPAVPSKNLNQCLYYLSYNNDAECIKYIIPKSDPTHNHSQAMRTAVQYGNPTTVALLLPVSAFKDCQDMLCEIVDQAIEDPSEEWLKALSVCLNIAPHWSPQALRAAIENDCEAVAYMLYPYVPVKNLLQIFEQNKNTQNSTIQQIHTRFKLDEIKSKHEAGVVNSIKKM